MSKILPKIIPSNEDRAFSSNFEASSFKSMPKLCFVFDMDVLIKLIMFIIVENNQDRSEIARIFKIL